MMMMPPCTNMLPCCVCVGVTHSTVNVEADDIFDTRHDAFVSGHIFM